MQTGIQGLLIVRGARLFAGMDCRGRCGLAMTFLRAVLGNDEGKGDRNDEGLRGIAAAAAAARNDIFVDVSKMGKAVDNQ